MAAAVITGANQESVVGDMRYISADAIAFAANGDTWTTPLRSIYGINLTPTTNTAFGFTISGGVLTLVSAGALTFEGGVFGK